MPAAVHVLCGPAASGKTQPLLERYRAAVRGAPGSALWLGPTRRAVEAVRLRLAEVGGLLAPNLFTFQDFADEIIRVNDAAARPLSHLQRRLLADDIVAELHAQKQLPHFQGVVDTRGFGASVFALLAELKQNEIWPEQFAEAVARRAEGKPNGQAAGGKVRQCALLYGAYQERLIQHQLYDPEGRFWYARDLLGRGVRRPFEGVRAVFVDGFTDFTRTQHEILQALAGWVEEMWLTLPDEEGEGRGELFTRSRATRAALAPLRPQVEFLPAGPPPIPAARKNGRARNSTRPAALPAGLAHLERELFRPLKEVKRSAIADGIACIEAPGMVGEARLVARQIRVLLLLGERPDDILVVLRDVLPYADLLREVFTEYAIPLDVEGTEPLLRNPAVATLLRALRLPDEDWPFAAVTALLRSGYFRPDWPATRACPEIAQLSEALLRLLGEPRGRESYLKAVERWAESVPPALEDEQAEGSRRQRTHELAGRCREFLRQFFHAWDGAPRHANFAGHLAWVRHLAEVIGVTRAAAESPQEAAALARLWDELERWAHLGRRLHGGARVLERAQFQRTLSALAAEAGLARTPRGPGRVRVLSAPLARGVDAAHVFVMGLGERSFPRLVPPEQIFDEQERQAFRQAGLPFPCLHDLLPDEMLLFYQVVTRARRRLVLSYPAVDEKGQALLPSSFLARVHDCFEPGAIPVERRRMLIEGYDRDVPLCAAEARVQMALNAGEAHGLQPVGLDMHADRSVGAGSPDPAPLPDRRSPSSQRETFGQVKGHGQETVPQRGLQPVGLELHADLRANLADAAELARLRFHLGEHTPYDGLLRDPAVVGEVCSLFGPERILSPTALENYIACPFKFFLGKVLKLEPLEEPSEEIESTDRGLAFHRALSRLHTALREAGLHQPEEAVDGHLHARLEEAVNESAVRASPAAEALWRLEGRRLQRMARRYRPHWQKFVEPWLPRGVRPRPEFFEVGFGLPGCDGDVTHGPLVITGAEAEVRISGRIDRVDVAELPGGDVGFWVIDYKTGRSAHYTGGDLKEFRRLQLTLYALAVQDVLLAGKDARPLGLAYWLVTDTGPKVALPGHPRSLAWLDETGAWRTVRERLRGWVLTLVAKIRGGEFPLKPRSEHCSQTCDFVQVCRISQVRAVVERKTWQLPLPVTS
jgi:ATP-dependent helicase/DNAse subunit B